MTAERTVRQAAPADRPAIDRVYAAARDFMRRSGNPDQWGDTKPLPADLDADLAAGTLWVIEEKGDIHAAFALLAGEDPTYAVIEGAWRDGSPYLTLHRVAGDGALHGVLRTAVSFALTGCSHLRIDTHEANKPMRGAIAACGFQYCGVIHLPDGSPRLAYEYSRDA